MEQHEPENEAADSCRKVVEEENEEDEEAEDDGNEEEDKGGCRCLRLSFSTLRWMASTTITKKTAHTKRIVVVMI